MPRSESGCLDQMMFALASANSAIGGVMIRW
jgi:hypothetical protein